MALNDLLKTVILVLICAHIGPFCLDHIKKQYAYFLEPHTAIGIVPIYGVVTDSSSYITQLYSFFKNPEIKGIIIKMNCHESAPGTSMAIFNEIQQLKKEYPKPIITLVENECLSGAYVIACASDYIIASEGALVGAIGANTIPHHLKQQYEVTENITHEIYNQTIKCIATARKLSLATVNNWANRQLFSGKQAASIGLINSTGSLSTVITLLKQKTFIDSTIEWVEMNRHDYRWPISISFFDNRVQ